QCKVAYETLQSCVRNSVPESSKKAAGEEVACATLEVACATWSGQNQNCSLFQCCVRNLTSNFTSNLQNLESSLSAPLHESFASNAFLGLSHAFFSP
ncbi:hypothetical protein PIB30_102839, partial [Stylosanthes scabra]|nr:hypothetical protein [Stylosanthes scabra]